MDCPNCGAPNAANAHWCVNCGAVLPARPAGDPDDATLIDVTDEPHVVPLDSADADDAERGWPYTFSTRTFERGPGRVVVARTGTRGCLVLGVVLALVLCCSCWALAQLLGNPGGFFDINWF